MLNLDICWKCFYEWDKKHWPYDDEEKWFPDEETNEEFDSVIKGTFDNSVERGVVPCVCFEPDEDSRDSPINLAISIHCDAPMDCPYKLEQIVSSDTINP